MPGGVVITHGLRSVYAKFGTVLRNVSAVELGRQVITELIERADIDPQRVDEAIVGCAGNPVDAANIARILALKTNLPRTVPAVTVQRNCGSGLEAITSAVERIRSGRAQVVIAAGVESMSHYPLFFSAAAQAKFEALAQARTVGARLGALSRFRPRDFSPEIALEAGLTDPVCGLNMGETAEVLAREFQISRDLQDEFALRSHQLVTAAEEAGRFAAERIPIFLPPGYDQMVDADSGPRSGQSMEALEKLMPVFDRRHGTVTAGNSCMVSDGGAAVLVMEEGVAQELAYEPLGRVAGYAWAGCLPRRMGLGPCYATPPALAEAGLKKLADLDLIELNEAFAAQVLACELCFRSSAFAREELGRNHAVGEIDRDRLNVNGGAIALGHPVGSSGTRLVVTLLHELARRSVRWGLATLCVGGGQGGAMVLER